MDNVETVEVKIRQPEIGKMEKEKEKVSLCTKCGGLPQKPCKQCGAVVFMCKACTYTYHTCRGGVSHSDQLRALKQLQDENAHQQQRQKQDFENELLKQELKQERDSIAKVTKLIEQKHKQEVEALQDEYGKRIHSLTDFYKTQQEEHQARTKEIIERYEFTIASLESEKSDLDTTAKQTTSQRDELKKNLEALREEFKKVAKEDKLPRVATLKKDKDKKDKEEKRDKSKKKVSDSEE